MSSPHSDSYDAHARKRVGKACDRCRLKKSKCDGASPCSRCKVDNAICVFGERKKSHDKVYPKGYVEMLEQQQSQLVAGIREMYKKLLHGDNWSGSPLPDSQEGFPLTHDILERLDVLHMTGDNPVKSEAFEDDLPRMRERLLEGGAERIRHRHDSVSTGSEPGLAHSESPHGTPNSQYLNFSEPNSRKRSSPSTPPASHAAPSRVSSKKRHYSTEIQQPEIQSVQQWGDSWESTQVADINNFQPDFNLFNSYDTPMMGAFDPLEVNPLTAPVLSTMSQVTMGSWPPQDPDFANFIQSGMPSGYHGPVVPA